MAGNRNSQTSAGHGGRFRRSPVSLNFAVIHIMKIVFHWRKIICRNPYVKQKRFFIMTGNMSAEAKADLETLMAG
jgi:hypothetical protein